MRQPRVRTPEGYDAGFFEANSGSTIQSAREIIPLILKLYTPSSIVDVGCGSGGWLRVFADYGIQNYVGVDGPYANGPWLEIPVTHFVAADIPSGLGSLGAFDLAVCLEVVEHLPRSAGIRLVDELSRLAPIVLFSAGNPVQPGVNHINGRWPRFWSREFSRHGFLTYDFIRESVWDNRRVSFWYAQNILLFVKREYVGSCPGLGNLIPTSPDEVRSLIHPRMFTYGLRLLRNMPASTIHKIGSLASTILRSPERLR